MESIREFLSTLRLPALSVSIVLTVVVTAAALILAKLVQILGRNLQARIRSWEGTRIRTFRIQSQDVLSAGTVVGALAGTARLFVVFLYLVLVYAYLEAVFSLYAATSGFALGLLRQVGATLRDAGTAFVDYLPNLVSILVIVVLTYYVNRLIDLVFRGIREGSIQVGGFYPEWAGTTAKIVRFFVMVFAAIMIFPYLPGSGSSAFQGVSIFFGLILSLGSTAAVANVVAGIVLTYTRAFRIGDFVRIADTMGQVTERTLLVTNVRTYKNVNTSIPNAMVLGNHIVNYSKISEGHGIILHTTVTIGYDAPWRRVHELLLAAAGSVSGIEKEPAPFVLQTALNDFYVSYELNATTRDVTAMPRIYSELHQAIQDRFNEAGVEIMSPHYSSMRDGNATAIPAQYLPGDYQPPPFRINPLEQIFRPYPAAKPGERSGDPGAPRA